MIYITGDTHGDFSRFSKEAFPEQTELTRDDYMIICGDFGGVWCGDERDDKSLDMLAHCLLQCCSCLATMRISMRW